MAERRPQAPRRIGDKNTFFVRLQDSDQPCDARLNFFVSLPRHTNEMKVLARRFLGDRTIIAYPHGNGFLPGGRHLILSLGAVEIGEKPLLLLHDLTDHVQTPLPPFPVTPDPLTPADSTICFDVALRAPRIVSQFQGVLAVLDLNNDAPPHWRIVHTQAPGVRLQDLPSISPDGTRCLIGEDRPGGEHAAVEIDLSTGRAFTIFTKPWHANHFHYSPHDPSWIGFSHEGPTEQIPDRCWSWHPELAPAGRVIFDQRAAATDPTRPLMVGHERWCFHDTSAYVIAYAVSPGGPRGIYEAFADGRPARLLRESNTAWHCSTDVSGRIISLDTSAPWDPASASPAEHAEGVARHLQADRERAQNISDVVLLDLVTGEDLHVARVLRRRHPYHPHPALSLDARWLVFTDYTPSSRGSWLVELAPLSSNK